MNIIDHLKSRGIDANRTHMIVDEQTGYATFLLYNFSGVLCGYQQYNPEGRKDLRQSDKKHRGFTDLMKYFTFLGNEGNVKKIAVWGVDTIGNESHIFVTEGIFDITKVHNFGEPGIAVLSNNPQQLKPWLKALGKTVIAILDNDDAGSKLSRIADISYTVPSPHKDLGDMSQEEANEFLSKIIKELNLV